MEIFIDNVFVAHSIRMPAVEVVVHFVLCDGQLQSSAQFAEPSRVVVFQTDSELFLAQQFP